MDTNLEPDLRPHLQLQYLHIQALAPPLFPMERVSCFHWDTELRVRALHRVEPRAARGQAPRLVSREVRGLSAPPPRDLALRALTARGALAGRSGRVRAVDAGG